MTYSTKSDRFFILYVVTLALVGFGYIFAAIVGIV